MSPGFPSRAILRLTLLVFSLGLLPKILLNVNLTHYGFGLALPGTLLLLVALIDWVPALLSRLGGSGWFFRAAVLAVLVAAVRSFFGIFAAFQDAHRQRHCPVFIAIDKLGEVMVGTSADLFDYLAVRQWHFLCLLRLP